MGATVRTAARLIALVAWAAGGAVHSAPYAPGFQYVLSPAFLGDDAAEPSIAFNPASRIGLYQSGIHTLRYVLPEYRTDDPLNPAGLPEACDTLWQDVTPPNGPQTTLDPIGVGDPVAQRYFASQMAVKSSALNFTDDDGATWTSSVGGSPGASGIDHQTVGWGPYVAGGLARPLTEYPNAIYYCAQDSDQSQDYPAGPRTASSSGTAGYTNCSRSDDGGLSFLPPTTVSTTVDCGGLSGHVRAAPDGTVYLPNKDCHTTQAVGVSEDMGATWTLRRPPASTPGTTDPSVALASDGTAYFCYANGDGHPHVVVSHDKGLHWVNDTDLGVASGVVTAVFPESIAGDPDRAACGFLATSTPGNSESEDFTGIWYPYLAVTYDGGLTWSVTNATPGDPAQSVGGICTQGLNCGSNNRNLLDFNDMTLDDRGRPLMAFADGCPGCTPATIGRSAKAAIARAVGGKSLYARLDAAEPQAPQAACLAGARSSDAAYLTWRQPAWDGRSGISGYRIYRATRPGAAGTLIASIGAGTSYSDSSVDASEPDYYYTIVAVNGAGSGVPSNRVRLSLTGGGLPGSVCVAPGVTMLDDAEGDAGDQQAAHDVRRLSISQPSNASGDYRLYFHLKVSDLSSLPAGTTWAVSFCAPGFACSDPGSPYAADNKYYTVEMSTVAPASTAAPAFQVRQPTAAGDTIDTRTVVPALAQSAYAPSGSITIVVDAAALGLQPAGAGVDALSKFLSGIGTSTVVGGVSFMASVDTMPDDNAGAGRYDTQAVNFCNPAPATAPPPPEPGVGTPGPPAEERVGGAHIGGGGVVPAGLLLLGLCGWLWRNRKVARPRL